MQILLSLLGFVLGGSFLGFLEFMIHRKDERNGRFAEIEKAVKEINSRLDVMEAKAEEREVVRSRVRILRFGDELRRGVSHSKDAFDQLLSDIDNYEDYCSEHPAFLNNKTGSTVEIIKHIYAERLEKNDFI